MPDPGWIAGLAAALTRAAGARGGERPDPAAARRAAARHLRHLAPRVARDASTTRAGSGRGTSAAGRTSRRPRAALRALGGWDERLGTGSPGRAAEDADLLYRLLRGGGTVRYEPSAVVRHEWQPRARRYATRWSYAYGVGTMAGLWLARGEPEAARWLAGYARMHVRPLLGALRRRDRDGLRQHARAIGGLVPGAVHGLRTGRGGR